MYADRDSGKGDKRKHGAGGKKSCPQRFKMHQLFCRRIRDKTRLVLFAALVVLASVAGAEPSSPEIQAEQGDQQPRQNASPSAGQVKALEIDLQQAQERAQLAAKLADLAERKLGAVEAAAAEKDDQLEAELKKAEERVQSAIRKAELAKSRRSALETELEKALGRAQLTEKDANLNESATLQGDCFRV
jgi:paraquat-inducible protein B